MRDLKKKGAIAALCMSHLASHLNEIPPDSPSSPSLDPFPSIVLPIDTRDSLYERLVNGSNLNGTIFPPGLDGVYCNLIFL